MDNTRLIPLAGLSRLKSATTGSTESTGPVCATLPITAAIITAQAKGASQANVSFSRPAIKGHSISPWVPAMPL